MQVGKQKQLFELFFDGKITKDNVQNLTVKMDKFLLINPIDGGFSKQYIESLIWLYSMMTFTIWTYPQVFF